MNIKTLYSADEIREAVQRTAQEVESFFGREEPVVALCLLNGAIWYAADLLRHLPANFELQTIRISSYAGTESTGKLKWHNALPDCNGKQVLVIDDVLDTGLTMKEVCNALRANGATKVASAVAIGLIPRELENRVIILGNAALSGASRILLNREAILEAKTLALNTTHVNLGGNSRFNAHFMDAMMFE